MGRGTLYGCRACGMELFPTQRDIAEHLTECEQATPETRTLARDWIAAGCPTIQKRIRSPRKQRPNAEAERR